jgi:hypothetical protein
MSALGQKQTSGDVRFTPKSGHRGRDLAVRFVPKADIVAARHFRVISKLLSECGAGSIV